MKTQHTLTCDVCQQVIEGISERGVKQGLGVHKSIVHGVHGRARAAKERKEALNSRGTKQQRQQWYQHVIAAKERRAEERSNSDLDRPMERNEVLALSPEQKKIRSHLMQQRWRAKELEHKRAKRLMLRNGKTQPSPATETPSPQVNNAIPIKVHVCGCCGARHYAVRDNDQTEEIKT